MLKKWLYAVLFLATFLVLLVGFFPLLVEEFVLPPILARVGLGDYQFSVSRLGLNGCSLHIAGQPHLSSPVVAGNIRIDWTPSGLLERRIEKISSNALQINLADLPSGKGSSQVQTKREEGPSEHTPFPMIVEQVTVDNGSLFFPAGKRLVYLPFTFSGNHVGDHSLVDPKGAIYFQVQVQSSGHIVNAMICLDPSLGKLSAKLDSNIDLASLESISPFSTATVQELKGNARLKVEAAVQMAPFSVEPVEATLVIDDLLIAGNGFRVRTQEIQPAEVVISGSKSQFLVKGTGFHVEGPLRTALDFDTEITALKNSLQWEGTLDLTPEPGAILDDRVVLKDVPPLRITHNGLKSEERISVSLTTGKAEDSIVGTPFVLQQDAITAAVEGFDIDARITSEQHSGVNTLAGTLSLKGRNVTVKSPHGYIKAPKLALQAEGEVSPGQGSPSFSARLNTDDVSIAMEKQQLEVQGVRLELPVVWPPGGQVEKGSLRVNTIRLDGKDLGHITAEIEQSLKEFNLVGSLQTPLFPKEKINLSGTVRLPKQKESIAELVLDLQDGHVAVKNFVPFFPALHGMTGTGKVNAQGNLAVAPCGLSGQANLVFDNGSLIFKDAETELEDISIGLQFPAFPSLNTSPRQQFTIGTIRKKKLVIKDVKTWFEIESSGSLFIEQISGRWGGGRVFTSSFRLQKDQDEFDLAIFCDRLELSSILSQFNLAEAGGEGRLSGRVPLKYSKGKFFVDDGFLFSSPGEKGYLKIKQSKYLETTIPADVPHFSPLHFAGAALADFEYNWAKLQIKSEEENLLLKLQVDGKPREKLPFRFDAGKNVFVRLDDENKGGIDQSIKLDVNFNIPLNEMLQYKDKFMPLIRKFN